MTATAIRRPAAVVIDIEGTVGSIRFVRDVLFPFARSRLRPFVLAHTTRPDVARALEAVQAETGVADVDGQVEQLERWSDADRKVTALKALQGMIWAGGYASGELVAHLYDDAIAALKRWAGAGLPVYVYSSGSIAAQKLYFAHTRAGNLTPGLAGYFDTTTGAEAGRRVVPADCVRDRPPSGRPAIPVRRRGRTRGGRGRRLPGGPGASRPPRDGLFEPSIVTFDELPI